MKTNARWARRAVWGTFVAVLAIGCNPITTVAFLLQGETKTKTDMPLRPHQDAKGEFNEDVKLVILCSMTNGATVDFAGADRELASLVAKKFPEVMAANGSKEKIKIVPAAQIEKFKASHPEAKYMNPSDLGRQLGADYVMDVTLSGLQIFQPGSASQIYQGRAEVNVDIYDCTKKNKEKYYTYIHPYSYPQGLVRDASAVPPSRFKMEFMHNLAGELVLKHIDHKPSVGIANGDNMR